MKTLTDNTTGPRFDVDCILSPVKGDQVFVEISIPLKHGEQAVRAFLEGWATAKGITLAKVSMCVYHAAKQCFQPLAPSLKWYRDCSGKLYFNQDQL